MLSPCLDLAVISFIVIDRHLVHGIKQLDCGTLKLAVASLN